MDAENLQFPDASFDLVCGSGILHHLKLDQAYAEISRVLTPSGAAIFLEPLGHNPFINLYRRMTPELRSVDEHPLLLSDLELARNYFESIDTRFFHLATLAGVGARSSKHFGSVVGALDELDATLFAMIPWLRKFAWISVITLQKQRDEITAAK
jgi:SAM-dependent methyltransferase